MALLVSLALLGLLFIYLECFLPGGVLAVLGGVSLILSWVLFLVEMNNPLYSALYLSLLILAAFLTVTLAVGVIKKSSKKGTFFLKDDQSGYVASHYDKRFIGQIGIASSDLGPSGYVELDHRDYQAIAKMGYIDKGTRVEVVGGEGSHLIVKKWSDSL